MAAAGLNPDHSHRRKVGDTATNAYSQNYEHLYKDLVGEAGDSRATLALSRNPSPGVFGYPNNASNSG
jgi:hypothetical protein